MYIAARWYRSDSASSSFHDRPEKKLVVPSSPWAPGRRCSGSTIGSAGGGPIPKARSMRSTSNTMCLARLGWPAGKVEQVTPPIRVPLALGRRTRILRRGAGRIASAVAVSYAMCGGDGGIETVHRYRPGTSSRRRLADAAMQVLPSWSGAAGNRFDTLLRTSAREVPDAGCRANRPSCRVRAAGFDALPGPRTDA